MANPQAPLALDKDGKPIAPTSIKPDGTPVYGEEQQGFWSSLWEQASPKTISKGLVTMGEWMLDPVKAGVELGQISRQYKEQGKPLGAVPIFGPPAQKAADQLRAGNYAGSAGTMTGAFGPMLLGEVMPAGVRVGHLETSNPAVAGAVRTALQEKVPLGPADMGIRGLGRAGYTADAASAVGWFKDWQTPVTEAFRKWGERLKEQARPGRPTSGEQAGTSVTRTERGQMAAQGARQNTAYGGIRTIADRHVEARPVARLDDKGNPVTVMEDMAAPTDMRDVKAAVAPIVARLNKLYTEGQRANEPGYAIMRHILDGDDYVPLDVAMEQLSAVGQRQRGTRDAGLRTKGQGRAAFAWGKLQEAVESTLRGLGDDAAEATRLWDMGRQATKAKFATAAELKRLGQTGDIPEGAKAFQTLVKPGDQSIGILARVVKKSPADALNIGRAWLEDRLSTVFRHGDVERARAFLKEWEDLGPKTKALLYPDTAMQGKITDFAVALKTWAESPNPSGTGAVNAFMQQIRGIGNAVIGTTQLGAATVSPEAVLLGQFLASGADVALHSTTVAKLLTRGLMTTPARGSLRAVGQMGTAGSLVGTQPQTAPRMSSATAPPKEPTSAEAVPAVVTAAGPGIHTLSDGTVWKVDANGAATKLK